MRRATGLHPKSIFQLAGPGTVGPGSLRGMPVLRRFRDAGWAVWPFDDPAARTVVELYPALAVGRSAGVASPFGPAPCFSTRAGAGYHGGLAGCGVESATRSTPRSPRS